MLPLGETVTLQRSYWIIQLMQMARKLPHNLSRNGNSDTKPRLQQQTNVKDEGGVLLCFRDFLPWSWIDRRGGNKSILLNLT